MTTDDNTKNFFAGIGLLSLSLPLLIGLALLTLIWRAWWLYPAWAWFIVPLGAPQISFWHFAALTFIAGIYTAHTDYRKDERGINYAAWISNLLIWPPLAFVILWWLR